MAVQVRTKKNTKAKSPQSQISTKICKVCDKSKKTNEYYKVDSVLYPDGIMDVCSDCLKETIDYEEVEDVIGVLRQMNKPFIKDVWEKAIETTQKLKTKPHPFGEYMKKINSLKQYKEKTFKDSEDLMISTSDMYDEDLTKIERDDGEEIKFDTHLIGKWGDNYSQFDLLRLEKFYQEMSLQYEIVTEVQKSLLRQLAMVNVEMDKALKGGNHKVYNDLAKTQNTIMLSAGFRPIDKKNISDETGLGSFSEIWAEIEKEGFVPKGLVDCEPDDIDDLLLYYIQGMQRFTDSQVSTELEDENWRETAQEMRSEMEGVEEDAE